MTIKRYDGGILGKFQIFSLRNSDFFFIFFFFFNLGTCWGTWNDFWKNTSISGASNAGKANEPPFIRRLIWVLIFSGFFYLTIFGVVQLFVTYYKYPVEYSVKVHHENMVYT